MKPLKDCAWVVQIATFPKQDHDLYHWAAWTDDETGLVSGHLAGHYLKATKEEAEQSWKDFAQENMFTKWEMK